MAPEAKAFLDKIMKGLRRKSPPQSPVVGTISGTGTISGVLMFELIASIVALFSLGVSAVLASRFKGLSDRLAATEGQLACRLAPKTLPTSTVL